MFKKKTVAAPARPPEKQLVNIEPSMLKKHSSWRTSGRWSAKFQVAIWLDFNAGLNRPVQLLLKWRDNERTKVAIVDRCLPNGQKVVLLNGVADIHVAGQVSNMALFVHGLNDQIPVKVIEWKLMPSQQIQRPAMRLSA